MGTASNSTIPAAAGMGTGSLPPDCVQDTNGKNEKNGKNGKSGTSSVPAVTLAVPVVEEVQVAAVMLAGMASATVAPTALDGPRLVTVIV